MPTSSTLLNLQKEIPLTKVQGIPLLQTFEAVTTSLKGAMHIQQII